MNAAPRSRAALVVERPALRAPCVIVRLVFYAERVSDVDRPGPRCAALRVRARAASPSRSASAAVGRQRVERAPPAPPAVGAATSPFAPCSTSSAGPPLSGAVTHGLAGAERLQRDEAVVLVPGREVDGAAARVVVDELGVGDRAQQLDAAARGRASSMRSRSAGLSSPSPAILTRSARSFMQRRRLDQQVEALQRVQARDREDVVAVAVGAVRALGRRRVEQLAAGCRRSAAAAPGSCATARPGA